MKHYNFCKKTLAMGLILSMAGSMLYGCGSKDSGSDKAAGGKADLTAAGTYPIVKKGKLKLSAFTVSKPNIEDFETNDFTKFLEKKTGIKISFQTGGRDDWSDKLNMILQSDDYPDIIFGANPDTAKYGVKEGIFLPLDKYINKKNCPNYIKGMKPYGLDLTRESDGKIYSMACVDDCYHLNYSRKMWVNRHYLDEMGVDVPKTTEEFVNVCKKFMKYKPDGVAVAGAEKGWSTRVQDFLIDAFTFMPSTSETFGTADTIALNKDTGKMECIATNDAFKQAMKYINSLYNTGAIYDGDFTQTEEQMKSLINQPDEPVLFFTTGALSNIIDPASDNERYRHYESMAPLAGPDGKAVAWSFPTSGVSPASFVVTDKCKNPEAAVRWADFFYNDYGYLCEKFGADEGKDWVMKPQGKKGVDGKPAVFEALSNYSAEAQNHDWQDVGLHIGSSEFMLGQAIPDGTDPYSPEGIEKLLYEATKKNYEPYAKNTNYINLDQLKVTDEEKESVSTIGVEIGKIIEEDSVAFMSGSKNIDKTWDSYVKALNQAGLKKLIKLYQKAYDRQENNGK